VVHILLHLFDPGGLLLARLLARLLAARLLLLSAPECAAGLALGICGG